MSIAQLMRPLTAIVILSFFTVITAYGQDRWRPMTEVTAHTSITALAFDPLGRLLIGYNDGHIRILDGTTLTDASVINNQQRIFQFRFCGSDTIYAWTDRMTSDVLRSVDRGATWRPIRSTDSVYTPVIVSSKHDVVAMLYAPGLHAPGRRSTDGGNHWIDFDRSQFRSSILDCIDMAAGPDGSLYAGFYGDSARNLYRSDDGGVHWSPLNLSAANIYNIVPTLHGPIVAECLTNIFNNSEVRGIFRSTDDGASWSLVLPFGFDQTTQLPYAGSTDERAAYSPAAGILIPISLGRTGVMRSTDDGASWASMTNRGMMGDTFVLAIAAGPNGEIICATLDNIYRYDAAAGVNDRHAHTSTRFEVTSDAIVAYIFSDGEGPIQLELYDMQGRSVRMFERRVAGGKAEQLRVPLDGIPSGAYVAVIRLPGGIEAQRIDVVR